MDTTPLRKTLSTVITDETLKLVAEEHRKGRRLFIGTTNLDSNLFTIWDMGEIAESDRPDRLKRYLDIVMASASFPIVFPPVYIEVEGSEGSFTEMHVDGGVREAAFFYDFTNELHRAAEGAGLETSDFKQELYLLINGKLALSPTYDPVDAGLMPIAGASVLSMMSKITFGSIFRLWVMSMADGADFHISYIPSDYEYISDTLEFDPEDMSRMYEVGYQQSLDEVAWATQEAPSDSDEIIRLISGHSYGVNRTELPAWMKRGNE